MKSLAPFEKRLDCLTIGRQLMTDDCRGFLAGLSWAELDKMSEIFIKHELAGDKPYENLSEAEIAFLAPIFERPVQPVPPIDHSKPACIACGNQPAFERDGSLPLCDKCFERK